MCIFFKNGKTIIELMGMFGLGRNKVTSTLCDTLGSEYTHIAKRIMGECGKKSAQTRRGQKIRIHGNGMKNCR